MERLTGMLAHWHQTILALVDDYRSPPTNLMEGPQWSAAWQGLWRILLLQLASVLVCWPALCGSPVWQDRVRVLNHPATLSSRVAERAWSPTSTAVRESGGTYQPLALNLLRAEHVVWGADTIGYHSVSLVLHALNVAFVWLILRRLAIPGGWLGACLFGVHPLALQSAAWLGQQQVLLATFFSLLTVLTFLASSGLHAPRAAVGWDSEEDGAVELPAEEPPGDSTIRWYWASVLCGICALLSGPQVTMLPLVLAVLLWWKGNEQTLVRRCVYLLPFIAVGALALVAASATGSGEPGWTHAAAASGPTLGRWDLAAWSLGHAVVSFAWPAQLSPAYRPWLADLPWVSPLLLSVVVGILALMWVLRARLGKTSLAAGLLLLATALPPVLLLPSAGSDWAFVADPNLYAATAVLAATCAAASMRLVARSRAHAGASALRWLRLAVSTLLIAAAGHAGWHRSSAYAGEISLWQDAVAANPGNPFSRVRLADAYLSHGDPEAADRQIQQIAGRNADWAEVHLIRGRILEALRDFVGAANEYARVLSIDANRVEAVALLANTYLSRGDIDRAYEVHRVAVEHAPDNPVLRNDLGLALICIGRRQEAGEQYRRAIELDERFIPARVNLANLLYGQGKVEEAAGQLQEVIKLDPANFEAYINAGAMLWGLKDLTKSELMLRAAVRLRPDSAEARHNLGIVLAAEGHLSEAAFQFARALQLNPAMEDARRNLEAARNELAAATRPASNDTISATGTIAEK